MTIIVIVWLSMSFYDGFMMLFNPKRWWLIGLWWIFITVSSIFIYSFFTQKYNQDETLLIKILKNIGKTFLVIIAILLIIIWWIGVWCGWIRVTDWNFLLIIRISVWLLVIFLIGSVFMKLNNHKEKDRK